MIELMKHPSGYDNNHPTLSYCGRIYHRVDEIKRAWVSPATL